MDCSPNTPSALPSLLHGFLHYAQQAPNSTALIDGPHRISYADLARAAEAVRRDLVVRDVRPGEYVGISMRRSWHVIAAILGTLAAGARYVPLDPDYPAPRLKYMAADSGISVVCVDEGGHFDADVPIAQAPITGRLADTFPDPGIAPAGGYVIYTSGSTGRPKGVIVPQRHVLNLFDGACASIFSFGPSDVWTLYHSYSFDFSVWEIWGALLFGGTLVIVGDDAKRDPDRLLSLMQLHGVTVLNQVPSPFKFLTMAYQFHPRPLASLRYVVFGGEAVDKLSVRTWMALRAGPEQMINMYGITETTVHVTVIRLTPEDVADDATPCTIGRPLPHLEVTLVRPGDGAPSADGEPGEIWVAGNTLSPGYLGHDEITAQRFVERAFDGTPRRWYRSGDLGVRRPDGTLEYLGRIDAQINLRGFRVELGEIEAALRADEAIADAAAAVATLRGDEQTLVAVVVAADGARQPQSRSLRDLCRRKLPAYMVPDRVEVVDAIPVTPGGGKVDRAAVAAMALRSVTSRDMSRFGWCSGGSVGAATRCGSFSSGTAIRDRHA